MLDESVHRPKLPDRKELENYIISYLEGNAVVVMWLRNLYDAKPRYYRENINLLNAELEHFLPESLIKAFEVCLDKGHYNARPDQLCGKALRAHPQEFQGAKHRGAASGRPAERPGQDRHEQIQLYILMNTDNIKRYCARLRLSYIPNNIDQLIVDAQNGKPTYEGFLEMVLKEETKTREHKAYLNRLKQAKLPPRYDLDEYDFSHSTGVSERQLKELRQLSWLNKAYNIILMGPSGTGKTYIASGLIYDAIKGGRKAYMISMEDILTCLRTKDISTAALSTYNKWLRADLLAIDDIMLFPVKKEESAAFFNLINSLHEKTSVIITTNKAPYGVGANP